MTKRQDHLGDSLAHVFYYPEGRISLHRLGKRELVDIKDPEIQALVICRWLARALPNIVGLKFCEFTGADYEKITWLGVGVHEDESKSRLQPALTPEQIQEVVALRYRKTARKVAAQYGVGMPTIYSIWTKYGGSSQRKTSPRLQGT